jgi:hypothetical protein
MDLTMCLTPLPIAEKRHHTQPSRSSGGQHQVTGSIVSGHCSCAGSDVCLQQHTSICVVKNLQLYVCCACALCTAACTGGGLPNQGPTAAAAVALTTPTTQPSADPILEAPQEVATPAAAAVPIGPLQPEVVASTPTTTTATELPISTDTANPVPQTLPLMSTPSASQSQSLVQHWGSTGAWLAMSLLLQWHQLPSRL